MHTLELTELGFSMLSWADGPRAVFSAVLASMFDDIGARRRMAYMPTPSFPHPALPCLVSPSELTPPARPCPSGPTEEESALLAGPGGYPDLGGGGGSGGGAGVATTKDSESADCASSEGGESSSDCDA